MSGALLQVRDLRTWFPTPKGMLHAVDGVSIDVERRSTLGVVGESGSGKTILTRSIMQLLPPTAVRQGEVRFDGADIGAMAPKQARALWGAEIARVSQDPMTSLNPVVRIGRQITETNAAHTDLSRAQARDRAADLLSQVGIPDAKQRLDAYPHELSGGMRQRVSIAIALSCSPRLLIADEPTTALDVTIQRQILDLLSALQADEGMAMVLVTHNLGIAASRCDRIAVMYAGVIVEVGPTRSMFKSMRHPYTAALLASIPRAEDEPGKRLAVIPGRPTAVVDPPERCRFVARCPSAQPRCLVETPTLEAAETPDHRFACFYPVGTPAGDEALAANRRAGATATGLELTTSMTTALLDPDPTVVG